MADKDPWEWRSNMDVQGGIPTGGERAPEVLTQGPIGPRVAGDDVSGWDRDTLLPFAREVSAGRVVPGGGILGSDWHWAAPQMVTDVLNAAYGVGSSPWAAPVNTSPEATQHQIDAAGAVVGPMVAGGLGRSAMMPKLRPGEAELGIFGGRKAATANHEMLAKAEQMAKEGVPREDIWKDTGWFQGADGKWRFEIDDSAAKYVPEGMKPKEYRIFGESVMGREGAVGDVLPHNALSAAYPDIPGMKVTRTNYNDGRLGHYDEGGGPFNMEEHVALNMGSPMFTGRDTMLHELQHAVQGREGFQGGANPSKFPKEGVPNPAHDVYTKALASDPELIELSGLRESGAYDRAIDAINENYAKNFSDRIDAIESMPYTRATYSTEIKPLLDKIFEEAEASNRRVSPDYARYDDLYRSLRSRGVPPREPPKMLSPEDAYRAVSGEAEARAVQARQDLTAQQRRERPPWLDYDVPEGQQIVRYDGDGPSASVEPAISSPSGLPMDEASKLVRAREMGFDVDNPLYVSLLQPTSRFDVHGKFMGDKGISGISLTDEPRMASRYLDRYGEYDYKQQPFNKNMMKVYIRPGEARNFSAPIKSRIPMGYPLPEGYQWPPSLEGIDTAIFPDRITARGAVAHLPRDSKRKALEGNEYILRDPSRIRAAGADFDPSKIDSSDLMASLYSPPAIKADAPDEVLDPYTYADGGRVGQFASLDETSIPGLGAGRFALYPQGGELSGWSHGRESANVMDSRDWEPSPWSDDRMSRFLRLVNGVRTDVPRSPVPTSISDEFLPVERYLQSPDQKDRK